MTSIPWDIRDAAERMDGASREPLIAALSDTLDQVFVLRGLFAWAATRLKLALSFKGFSNPRRPYGEKQVELFTQAARGEAEAVAFERQQQRLEQAARSEGLDSKYRLSTPGLDTSGPSGHEGLRLGLAYALKELRTLRQLAAYEAGVLRAHDIPSGPKTVRRLLEEADQTLLLAAKSDLTPDQLPDSVRAIDVKQFFPSAGAKDCLTNGQYLADRGLGGA